jgi:hypothetical protein
MNGFRRLQTRLREEGWYVGWNLPCCQSCAWWEVPDQFEDGTQVDLSKVLFNHSQDCEVDHDYEDCEECEGEGCDACEDEGFIKIINETGEFDDSVDGFVCHTPEQQHSSTFCFAGDKPGVKNLKAIIPIIEECGCSIHWNGKGDTRPEISWEE